MPTLLHQPCIYNRETQSTLLVTNGTTEKNETMTFSTSEHSPLATEASSIVSSSGKMTSMHSTTTEASSIVSSIGKMTSMQSTTTEASSIVSSTGKITTMDSLGTSIGEHSSTTSSSAGSSSKLETTETMHSSTIRPTSAKLTSTGSSSWTPHRPRYQWMVNEKIYERSVIEVRFISLHLFHRTQIIIKVIKIGF